jgi:hypothetical protein
MSVEYFNDTDRRHGRNGSFGRKFGVHNQATPLTRSFHHRPEVNWHETRRSSPAWPILNRCSCDTPGSMCNSGQRNVQHASTSRVFSVISAYRYKTFVPPIWHYDVVQTFIHLIFVSPFKTRKALKHFIALKIISIPYTYFVALIILKLILNTTFRSE